MLAHRGAHGRFGEASIGENTLAACQKAAELGCAGAEIDAHLTRDRELLVVHGPTGAEIAAGAVPLSELTAAEVLALHPEAPRLEAVLELALAAQLQLQIELKGHGCGAAVARAVRSSGMPLEQVSVCSFFPERLSEFAAELGGVQVIRTLGAPSWAGRFYGIGPDHVLLDASAGIDECVEHIGRAAAQVGSFCVDVDFPHSSERGQHASAELLRCLAARGIGVGLYWHPSGEPESVDAMAFARLNGASRVIVDTPKFALDLAECT